MKCPYNDQIICSYIEESITDRVYECADCTHYNRKTPDPEEEQVAVDKKHVNLFTGIISIGILLSVIGMFVAFLFGLSALINWLRP